MEILFFFLITALVVGAGMELGRKFAVPILIMVLIILFLSKLFILPAYGLDTPRPPAFMMKTEKSWALELLGMVKSTRERHPKLIGVHKDLKRIMKVADDDVALIVFTGYRSPGDQLKMYKEKKSKIKAGGKHNSIPSCAIDVVFKNKRGEAVWSRAQAYAINFYLKGIGKALGIKTRIGSTWDGSFDVSKNDFVDAFHVELVNCS